MSMFFNGDVVRASGISLPKFGEWDVNDPASAEGYTVIFNNARDEKKGGSTPVPESLKKDDPSQNKDNYTTNKPQTNRKKWLCCM